MDLSMHSPPDSKEVTPVAPVAVTNERWRLRGAHDDAFRIPADGWSYPFASGVTVLSRGEIRRDIRSRDFPRAFVFLEVANPRQIVCAFTVSNASI